MHVDLARVQFAFISINAGRPHHRPRRPAATPDAARFTVRRYGPLGEREGCVFAAVVGWPWRLRAWDRGRGASYE